MGASRLPMRQIREILRLKYEGGLGHRAIARSCGVGLGTVSEYVGRARRAGLAWPLPPELDDAALEARLFVPAAPGRERAAPDLVWIHQELKRAGVTLHLLWEEYRTAHEDGYGLDPADQEWHADGTRHIDHDHLVIAIRGLVNGEDLPVPGETPQFTFHFSTWLGDEAGGGPPQPMLVQDNCNGDDGSANRGGHGRGRGKDKGKDKGKDHGDGHDDGSPEQQWGLGINCEMARVSLARHGWSINASFTDLSCRKVRLPELWDLQWHRQWEPQFKTKGGFVDQNGRQWLK